MTIRWRPISFVALVWTFIVLGPAGCQMIPTRCKPHVIATCEP